MTIRDSDRATSGAKSALEMRAKQLFDASVAGLSAEERSRLNRARERAMAAAGEPLLVPTWFAWRGAVAVASVIVGALVGYSVWQADTSVEAPQAMVAEADDLELLLGDEELEMLEDLEFYAWLEEQPDFETPSAGEDGSG